MRLLSLESSLLALMADEYRGHRFHLRSIYQGSDQTKGLRANRRFITPMTLSAVPELFKKLTYRTDTLIEDETVVLKCSFDK